MNAEIALLQLRMSRATIKANLGGITHEESLRQPKPAGNCANWVLGHLVSTRCTFLQDLGGEPVWSDADRARYDRHAPPITEADDAIALEEIWRAFEESQERLLKAVSELKPAQLAAKSRNDPDQTIGATLATLGFHDAYHAGQTGLLRRLLGKPPADL